MNPVVKKILFRVDASAEIGAGHFMRCLSLAEKAMAMGAEVTFACRHVPEHLRALATSRGAKVVTLPAAPFFKGALAHSHWLGVEQTTDAQQTSITAGFGWDWVVVDHYGIDRVWEAAFRPFTKKIMVIDDLMDREHDCELLVDQNNDDPTRYGKLLPPHAMKLLGPRFALIREDFAQAGQSWTFSVDGRRVLVAFGGADTANNTALALSSLVDLQIEGVKADVVIGATHPQRQEIESVCATRGYHCHVQTQRMPQLMAQADLAIGAGGGMLWERCCLGLPSVVFCVADNQREQLETAAEMGACDYIRPEEFSREVLTQRVAALLARADRRDEMGKRAASWVDGKGLKRVVRFMGLTNIDIRRASADDCRRTYEWRNHPRVRAASLQTEPIEWQGHQSWFKSVLLSPEVYLLIGSRRGQDVGVVRFNVSGERATVSLYLATEFLDAGVGGDLLQSAQDWLLATRPELQWFDATVRPENTVSRGLFFSLGYACQQSNFSKQVVRHE